MSISVKTFFFAFLSMITLSNYGQMIEGNYPFQIIDSLIFKSDGNIFQIDTNSKPDNFISTIELGNKRGLEINTEDQEDYLNRINEIHSITNNRDFIAGITNNSTDTIFLPIQDESLIAILEAKNQAGFWKPIQFWPISGCGNSYYSENINPEQSILITVSKNYGNIETALRLRLHGTDTVFVSESFNGTINLDMFVVKKDILMDFKHILCDSVFYLESPFYGNLNYDGIEIIIIEEDE